MIKLEFFYADIQAHLALLNYYPIDEWIHANNGVVASRLRGGLLTGCNVRFAFIPSLNGNYRQEDMDYKNQGLYIFQNDLYFRVLDKFYIGDKVQVLMSPINSIAEYDLEKIISTARDDFKALQKAEPVAELNNREWKQKVAIVPGIDAKNSPLKGFLTDY